VSYSLALLDSPSWLIGAVGSDFDPYGEVIGQLGVDLTHVLRVADHLTAAAFMMADLRNNHIASFYPGPAAMASRVDARLIGDQCRYALVGATTPDVMVQHAEEFGASSARLIFDPAFQITLLSPQQLVRGMENAWCIVSNDYEYAMIERKTGLTVKDISDRVELVVVTYGETGSELITGSKTVRVPAAPVSSVVDPTGAGDAYRSGLIKGLLLDLDLELVGRLAGLTAAYAVEQVGTQEHYYTIDEFVERFDLAFPDFAGSITSGLLSRERQTA
jgi:adenosine kinase